MSKVAIVIYHYNKSSTEPQLFIHNSGIPKVRKIKVKKKFAVK